MQCLKCAQEIEDGQVFCDRCLEEMAQYPVKPGTKLHLPNRPGPDAAKKPLLRKREPSPQEQLRRYREIIKWMTVSIFAVILLLVFALALLLETNRGNEGQQNIGQNYNTVGREDPAG